MSTRVADLLQKGAGPAPAPLDVEALRRRAAQRRRNRRTANVVVLVLVAVMVSAPLVWLTGREPAVVLDGRWGEELLGVFEGTPAFLEDNPFVPAGQPFWRTTEVGGYTI